MLTEFQIDKYIARDGNYCPYCGVDNCYPLEGSDLLFPVGRIEQDMVCFSCSKRWTDVYQLNTIIEETTVI